MIEIQTYIATKPLKNIQEDLNNYDRFFINLEHEKGLEILKQVLTENKAKYLNGLISISINGEYISTFIDWDDLDLMWPALLTMVLDYLNDGQYGETDHFSNGMTWSVKKIVSSPYNLVHFKVIRSSPLFDLELGLPVTQVTQGVCGEDLFIDSVIQAAEKYIDIRNEDTRSQNLVDAKQKLKVIKKIR